MIELFKKLQILAEIVQALLDGDVAALDC